MGRKNRSSKSADPGKAAEFKVNPFAALALCLPKGEPPAAPKSVPKAALPPPARAAVDPELAQAFGAGPGAVDGGNIRLAELRFACERKGHAGKTVTTVRGLAHLSVIEQMDLLQAAKQALGVGGTFVEGVLQLQGDQRDRAQAWFKQRCGR